MTPSPHDELARHAEALRRLARKLVGSDGPWEDLVQGTYLTALERPPKLLSREWLARVLRNRAHDHHRRERSTRAEVAAQRTADISCSNEDGSAIAERIEVHAELVAAVRALREPYRSAVFLRYFDDLTPTQIAAREGLPVKTVKTRLVRGIAQLRERLDRDLGTGGRGGLAVLLPLAFPHELAPTTLAAGVSTTTGIGIMIKKVTLVCAVALGVFGLYRYQGQAPLTPSKAEAGGGLEPQLALQADESREDESPAPTEENSSRSTEEREVTAAVPTGLGSLLVRVLSKDGTPRSGVAVGVRTAFPDAPRRGLFFEPTDEAGQVRVSGLSPGRHYVFCDRDADAFVTVEAEVEQALELHVGAGLAVHGLVVDGDGHPVAGASIWLANGRTRWMGGRVVASADTSGNFRVPDAPRGVSFGALAEGYAPSALVDLDLMDLSKSPVELRLVLNEPGGELSGVVLDPRGEPVAGALVAVGKAASYRPMRLGPGRVEAWSPRCLETDEDGRFHCLGLALGVQRVTVRAEGFPLLQEEFEVLAGATPVRELILSVGGSIEGRVLDSAGAPVAGAFVRAFDQTPTNLDDSYVDRAQFDYSGTFSYPFAKTDADGRYLVSGVRPGTVLLFANPADRDNEIQPFDRTSVQLAPNGRVRWDAILSTGLSISGTVLFKSGAPVDEVHVIARDENSGQTSSCVTDDAGRFEIIQLEDAPHTVWVQLWPRIDKNSAEAMQRGDVRPGAATLTFVASIDDPQPVEDGTVRGLVDDRAGRMLGGAGATLNNRNDSSFQVTEVTGGAFSFDYVVPGSYRLVLSSTAGNVLVSETFEVAPGEDVDLGTLVTEPAGTALVRLTRPAGSESASVTLGCQLVGSSWGPTRIGESSQHNFEGLAPGAYILHLQGAGVASLDRPFEVLSGAETVIDYALEPAVRRTIELWQPEGVEVLEARVVVDFVGGRNLLRSTLGRSQVTVRPMLRDLELPLGRFRVQVEASGGLEGSAEFEMSSLEAGQPAIRVELE